MPAKMPFQTAPHITVVLTQPVVQTVACLPYVILTSCRLPLLHIQHILRGDLQDNHYPLFHFTQPGQLLRSRFCTVKLVDHQLGGTPHTFRNRERMHTRPMNIAKGNTTPARSFACSPFTPRSMLPGRQLRTQQCHTTELFSQNDGVHMKKKLKHMSASPVQCQCITVVSTTAEYMHYRGT